MNVCKKILKPGGTQASGKSFLCDLFYFNIQLLNFPINHTVAFLGGKAWGCGWWINRNLPPCEKLRRQSFGKENRKMFLFNLQEFQKPFGLYVLLFSKLSSTFSFCKNDLTATHVKWQRKQFEHIAKKNKK